jgi:hypothetical protein
MKRENQSTGTLVPSWLKQMASSFYRIYLLAFIPMLFAGCKKDTYLGETKGVCPIVVSTDPINGATNVNTIKKITATFNEAMDPATINGSTFTIRHGAIPVAGVVTYSGLVAMFSPAADLLANTVYTATITNSVRDPAGNAMVADYVWSFNTGTTPIVVSTDPANGAINVALNKVITATFSTVMNASTITATSFMVKNGVTPVAGVISYSGMTASFTPAVPLLPGTIYTGTITSSVRDTAGNAMAANYTWSFVTSTIPFVVSTDPANGAVNVALNKVITATFSNAMNPATINGTSFTISNGATPVAGTITYTGMGASFTPTLPLLPATTYTGTITTAAQDNAGNSLPANYVWTFRTIAAPYVVSTDPANLATSVPLNKRVSAIFSEVMNPSTINSTTFLLKQGLTPVAGIVTYTGTTATFTPSLALLPNTTYTATITTGAQNTSGNGLGANYTWSFATIASVPPPSFLASIAMFGVFGGSAGVTNQGLNTVINNGGLGTTGASTLITGFHDGTNGDVYTETPLNKGLVTGGIFTAPPPPGTAASFAIATQGLADANAAYLAISPASKPGGTDPGSGELGGLTLTPGVYKSAGGTFKISNGNLTLDGQGDPNAEFFFQAPTSLTVGIAGPLGARSVILINGAQAKNVYWYVGTAATINGAGGGVMTGTIISSAGLTFSTAGNAVQTVLNGRAVSLNASVTVVNTTINVPL